MKIRRKIHSIQPKSLRKSWIIFRNGEGNISVVPVARYIMLFLMICQTLQMSLEALIAFTWLQSLLLATWLVDKSCEDIRTKLKSAAWREHLTTKENETDKDKSDRALAWKTGVLEPVRTLATSTIPLLSESFGATLGLVFLLYVAYEVCMVSYVAPCLKNASVEGVDNFTATYAPMRARHCENVFAQIRQHTHACCSSWHALPPTM